MHKIVIIINMRYWYNEYTEDVNYVDYSSKAVLIAGSEESAVDAAAGINAMNSDQLRDFLHEHDYYDSISSGDIQSHSAYCEPITIDIE